MVPEIIDNAYAAGIGLCVSGAFLVSQQTLLPTVVGVFLIVMAVIIIIWRLKIEHENNAAMRRAPWNF